MTAGQESPPVLDTTSARFIERVTRNVRYSLRSLARAPGFTVVVVTCLALGLGANAAVYSWMDGIVTRPYPGVADQSGLVALANTLKGSPDPEEVSWPDFVDLRTRTGSAFSAFIASKITGATITGGDRAERAVGLLVSANYFDALGVRPMMGRGFLPGEDTGNRAHPVCVIGYRVWQDRFGGDRAIVGKTIAFNGVPHTIVGVAPREFLGTFIGYAMQFWVPAAQQAVFDPSGYKLDDRGARWIEGFVRLAPGVSLERAQSEVSAAAARLATDYANFDRGRGVRLFALHDAPFDNAKELQPTLRVMALVGAFVLLIVCANVANLLSVRALARRHEMTVRTALGASRGRLVQQVMTEGALLALAGSVVGLAIAYASRNVLGAFFPPRGGVTLVIAGAFDWRVVGVTAAAGITATVLFAAVPALEASSVDLASALKADSRLSTGGPSRGRARASLVILQVCLSFILLVGTGLVLISVTRERNEAPGFAMDDLVMTGVNLFGAGYDSTRARRFDDNLIASLRSVAGVRAVALARSAPFTTRPYDSAPVGIDGRDLPPDDRPVTDFTAVSPGYFATVGIGLTAGREFTTADADTSQPVAIVSAAFATKFWPGQSALGHRVQLNGQWRDVVGVARDVKYRTLLKAPATVAYVPLAQDFSTALTLFVRAPGGAASVARTIVDRMHAIDPAVSPYEILTMREQVVRSTAPQQIAATLVASFAVVALFLAAIGLYGVVAAIVSQTARELSVRLAVGASPGTLMRFVIGRGVRLAAAGSVIGACVSLLFTRLLGDLLFKVSARDPVTLCGAFVVMIVVATGACLVPAWRAARSDPASALRA
ncbi:MAG TPA: ABC transporter permease [Gemmatimonadaceae bacterium]|jgi:predicted permease|nr:ABC transporter permease [Gemmatimonadaceae bacterium]